MKTSKAKIVLVQIIRPALSVWLIVAPCLFVVHSAGRAAGDEWRTKASLPTARLGLAACAVEGKVYAMGGFLSASSGGVNTVEAYDPVTDSWVRKAPMPTARYFLTASAVNGKIYAIGGSTAFGAPKLQTVEEYDPATDTWTQLGDMPTASFALASCVVDGQIYVLGGAAGDFGPVLRTVEAYNPVTDSWTRKQDLPTERGLTAAVQVGGQIYVMGSGGPTTPFVARVDRYDPKSDTWVRVADMPTARAALTVGVLGGKIYAVGGRNISSAFSVVEEYDPLSDTWLDRAGMEYLREGRTRPLRMPRWALASAVVDDKLYVLGGASDTSPPHPGMDTVIEYTPPVEEGNPVEIMPEAKLNAEGTNPMLILKWQSEVGVQYIVRFKATLHDLSWNDVMNVVGTGDLLIAEVSADKPSGFYHIVTLQTVPQ